LHRQRAERSAAKPCGAVSQHSVFQGTHPYLHFPGGYEATRACSTLSIQSTLSPITRLVSAAALRRASPLRLKSTPLTGAAYPEATKPCPPANGVSCNLPASATTHGLQAQPVATSKVSTLYSTSPGKLQRSKRPANLPAPHQARTSQARPHCLPASHAQRQWHA
jgi:hypothetical protein